MVWIIQKKGKQYTSLVSECRIRKKRNKLQSNLVLKCLDLGAKAVQRWETTLLKTQIWGLDGQVLTVGMTG